MADQPTPPTNTPTPAETTTTVAPVTTQNVSPTTVQEAGKPTLEVQQTRETVDALNALFDQTTPPAVTSATPPVVPPPTETAAQTPPAAEPPKTGTPVGTDDEFSKRIDGIKPPPGAHPNVAAGLEQLKKEAVQEHTRAEQLQTQLKELQAKAAEYETKLKENKLPEPIEKELKELRERVRETDYQSDPEFQKTYVQPVQRAESEILGLLKQAGLKDEGLKQIQENGGIIAMSQSGEPAGVEGNPDMTMAEWVDKFLLAKTPGVFRNRINSKLANAVDLIERGRGEIEDFRANSQQRHEQRMQKQTQLFDEGRKAALSELGDLAQPKTIPATATAVERQAIEAHNKIIAQANETFQTYLQSAKDPQTAGKVLVKATQADVLLSLHRQDQALIKQLQDRLNGIKAAGSHSQAGNNTPPPGVTPPDKNALLHQSTEQAMAGLFNTQPNTP